MGRCVRGETEFAGAPQSQITFDRSMSQESTRTELGFQVGLKVRYGLLSGSGAAQFASESSSSEFSDVTTYAHIISLKDAKLRFPGLEQGLTPEGRAAKGDSSGPIVGDNWPLTCGGRIRLADHPGRELLISVSVEFATREDKISSPSAPTSTSMVRPSMSALL
jgi:hypothetical protein